MYSSNNLNSNIRKCRNFNGVRDIYNVDAIDLNVNGMSTRHLNSSVWLACNDTYLFKLPWAENHNYGVKLCYITIIRNTLYNALCQKAHNSERHIFVIFHNMLRVQLKLHYGQLDTNIPYIHTRSFFCVGTYGYCLSNYFAKSVIKHVAPKINKYTKYISSICPISTSPINICLHRFNNNITYITCLYSGIRCDAVCIRRRGIGYENTALLYIYLVQY